MFYHFRSVIILHFRSLRFSYLSYSKENCFAIFHNDELEYVFEQKDLGIILDVDLKCDEYISTNVVVRFIRWSLWYLDGPLFQKLSTAFVRPHLGYGRLIWASYLKKQSIHLKSYSVVLLNLWMDMNFELCKKIKKLDIPSLTRRRPRVEMTEKYKRFHSYDTVSYHDLEAQLLVEMKYIVRGFLLLLHSKSLEWITENC